MAAIVGESFRQEHRELQEDHDHLVLLLSAIVVEEGGGELTIPHHALDIVSGDLLIHNDGENYTFVVTQDGDELW